MEEHELESTYLIFEHFSEWSCLFRVYVHKRVSHV